MKKTISILLFLIFNLINVLSQDTDTSRTEISAGSQTQHFDIDTLAKKEISPLDIGKDRGLYILTKDGKMQLRILGSVRFSILYDFIDFPIKKSFKTYYIPTGDDNKKLPNFYSTLSQSRIGFEVNRKLENKDVFIRLESDFNGSNGQFRIRHAYGQIGNFLVGQTWSLFSNISSMPATVDGDGPTGSVTLRTAQMRYSGRNNKGTRWALALEYSRPDLTLQEFDTVGLSTVQLIPDFTARIERVGIFGAVQLSAVLTTLSMKDVNDKVHNTLGIGGSLSGTIDFTEKHQLLYQVTYGKSISHFITTFSGTGKDATYNPQTGNLDPVMSLGAFISYGFNWTEKLLTNVSGGYADLSTKDYQADDAYKNSMSISLDTFWNFIDGARLGLEYVYGQRWDKNGVTGSASRIWVLFYYDF